MISHLTCGWSGELLDAGCCPQCGEPYPIDYDYFITAPVTEVEEFDRHPKSKKYKKKKLNVTRQANPMRTTITREMTGGHSERRTLFAIMRAALPVSVSMTSGVSKTSMPQIVQQSGD